MITNEGKNLIGKYMLGQAPAYASHISIGCGQKPLEANDIPSTEELDAWRAKSVMDFEMTRVPITSKGFVDDNGTTKISLTAELPSENRYDITEVGLWSAGNNNLASNSDSHMIFSFAEPWQIHDTSITNIPVYGTSGTPIGSNGDITITDSIFAVSTSDSILRNASRVARKEGPRYLNQTILVKGDTATINGTIISITSASANGSQVKYTASNSLSAGDRITIVGCSDSDFDFYNVSVVSASASAFIIASTVSGSAAGGNAWKTGTWAATEASTHIHLTSVNLNIANNSPSDELKLAFSLTDKTALAAAGDPDAVKILIEFYRNEITTTSGYAKAEIYINGTEFSNNRYHVVTIPISSLVSSTDFSASQITVCRIFTSIIKSGNPSSDFYNAYDAFRIDNITTENPLYKMVGYSVVKIDGKPIVKLQNTNNYIEFRLSLGIT